MAKVRQLSLYFESISQTTNTSTTTINQPPPRDDIQLQAQLHQNYSSLKSLQFRASTHHFSNLDTIQEEAEDQELLLDEEEELKETMFQR